MPDQRATLRKTPHDLVIRTMQPADIAAVSGLAERIWRQHYRSIISQAQIDYMLEMMYSAPRLKEQIEQGHLFWLIYDGSELAGYVSVEKKSTGQAHIHKLYVDVDRHGKGLGSALIEHVIATLNPKRLTLGVNRCNYKAINFYFRHGFTIAEMRNHPIGNGFIMEDFIMQRDAE